jgi:hypothetical protein
MAQIAKMTEIAKQQQAPKAASWPRWKKAALALSRPEWGLLLATVLLGLLAVLGPVVVQDAHYHQFADTRSLWGIAHAADVLSNLPFAGMGLWGLCMLWRQARFVRQGPQCLGAQWVLAGLFFAGLLTTTLCSSLYHLQPDDAKLAWDRIGMVPAFAGLLGLVVADRISTRAAWAMAGCLVLAGWGAVAWWFWHANLLPWAVVQGGGLLLLVGLALCRPRTGAWGVPALAIGLLVAIYALAKGLELADHALLLGTGGWVSGHTLKHVVAAMSALPIVFIMHNVQRYPLTKWF